MAKAGFNDDIVKITQGTILGSPVSQVTLEAMLKARVYALIGLDRKDEALADARRFYNVCPLDRTGIAVDLLVKALEAKLGDAGEAQVREFRMHQITASASTEVPIDSTATTNPATQTLNASDQLLLTIHMDDGDYMEAAAKWKANRRYPLAYGNLLLMAGHADEAYAYYTDFLSAPRSEAELVLALERQSTAMRAQDGNTARAQSRLRRLRSAAEN
jgi:hypothetical protein